MDAYVMSKRSGRFYRRYPWKRQNSRSRTWVFIECFQISNFVLDLVIFGIFFFTFSICSESMHLFDYFFFSSLFPCVSWSFVLFLEHFRMHLQHGNVRVLPSCDLVTFIYLFSHLLPSFSLFCSSWSRSRSSRSQRHSNRCADDTRRKVATCACRAETMCTSYWSVCTTTAMVICSEPYTFVIESAQQKQFSPTFGS